MTTVCIKSLRARLEVADQLVTTKFAELDHRAVSPRSAQPDVAVCLLPGTEVAFERDVECEPSFGIGILPTRKLGQRLARFRQVDLDNPTTHHDALEFPNGQIVLLTRLCAGQRATVLQLPASAHRAAEASRAVCLIGAGLTTQVSDADQTLPKRRATGFRWLFFRIDSRGEFGRARSGDEERFRFAKRDQRLELVAAGVALPQVTDAMPFQIFRPFRKKNCLATLGALDWQFGLRDISSFDRSWFELPWRTSATNG